MRILLTGASGQLGAYLIDRLLDDSHDLVAWSGRHCEPRRGLEITPVDLTNGPSVESLLDEADPDVIIHAAAISSAEAVRLDPTAARAINVEATGGLAAWATHRGRKLVFTSTDLVFDGTRPWAVEDDLAEPILDYGRTKREAEDLVLAVPRGVVSRLSLLYGPTRSGRSSYFDAAIEDLRAGRPRAFFEDEFRTPLDLETASETLIRLAVGEFSGTIHVAGRERMSRFELMRRAATVLGLDASLVRPGRRGDVVFPEPRPADVSLDTTKLGRTFLDLVRPSVEESLRPG